MREKSPPMRDFHIQFINERREKEKKGSDPRRIRSHTDATRILLHVECVRRGTVFNARSSRGTPNVSKYSACVGFCQEPFFIFYFFRCRLCERQKGSKPKKKKSHRNCSPELVWSLASTSASVFFHTEKRPLDLVGPFKPSPQSHRQVPLFPGSSYVISCIAK